MAMIRSRNDELVLGDLCWEPQELCNDGQIFKFGRARYASEECSPEVAQVRSCGKSGSPGGLRAPEVTLGPGHGDLAECAQNVLHHAGFNTS